MKHYSTCVRVALFFAALLFLNAGAASAQTAPAASGAATFTVTAVGKKEEAPSLSGGGVTRGTRRPARAPANTSSGIPSGNGMTAASVIAGGPPTKMLTRKGTPRRSALA